MSVVCLCKQCKHVEFAQSRREMEAKTFVHDHKKHNNQENWKLIPVSEMSAFTNTKLATALLLLKTSPKKVRHNIIMQWKETLYSIYA